MKYTVETPAGEYLVMPDNNLCNKLAEMASNNKCDIEDLILYPHKDGVRPKLKVVLEPCKSPVSKITPPQAGDDLPMDSKGNIGTGIKPE